MYSSIVLAVAAAPAISAEPPLSAQPAGDVPSTELRAGGDDHKPKLTEAGAAVHLETYEGGHGWHGDVFGNIRRGVEWLEARQSK